MIWPQSAFFKNSTNFVATSTVSCRNCRYTEEFTHSPTEPSHRHTEVYKGGHTQGVYKGMQHTHRGQVWYAQMQPWHRHRGEVRHAHNYTWHTHRGEVCHVMHKYTHGIHREVRYALSYTWYTHRCEICTNTHMAYTQRLGMRDN